MAARKRRRNGSDRTSIAVQLLATIAASVMVILNQYTEPDINDLFIWAMYGLAYGARPETVHAIFRGRP